MSVVENTATKLDIFLLGKCSTEVLSFMGELTLQNEWENNSKNHNFEPRKIKLTFIPNMTLSVMK